MTILIACGLLREVKIMQRPGIVPLAGGGVAARLEAALETYIAQNPATNALFSSGIAGALDPALAVGDVIIDAPPALADQLLAHLPGARTGKIVGRSRITATMVEKSLLRSATGAAAVDMESHIAARVAARHGLPFAAIRTISDTAQDSLPPAALVGMKANGGVALGRVLASLARRPAQLPALLRTGRSAEAAFGALGRVYDALVRIGVGRLDLGKLPLDMG
ncbi:MAG: phosphorylase [Sphingomonas sp.]